jgi:hypothetical protein
VTLDLPGWQRTDADVPRSWQRTTTLRQGDATVVMDRWFGTPPAPGGPMVVAGERPVTISGEEHALQRTSMFQGRPDEVDVVFLRDTGWQVRVVFRGCSEAQIAEVLARLSVAG